MFVCDGAVVCDDELVLGRSWTVLSIASSSNVRNIIAPSQSIRSSPSALNSARAILSSLL